MCNHPDFDFFKGAVVAVLGGGVIWMLGYFLAKFLGIL